MSIEFIGPLQISDAQAKLEGRLVGERGKGFAKTEKNPEVGTFLIKGVPYLPTAMTSLKKAIAPTPDK